MKSDDRYQKAFQDGLPIYALRAVLRLLGSIWGAVNSR